MEALGSILFFFVCLAIILGILYWIVWRVVHDSDVARDVQEIKRMLRELQLKQNPGHASGHGQSADTELPADVDENCPACGERVPATDSVCPGCGLTLVSIDDGK